MTEKPHRTILIIDDSPEDRAIYRQHLRGDAEYEYQFIERELGEDGLTACHETALDCILIDYMLPDMDGLEVLAELTGEDGHSRYPVVMLTGTGNEGIAVRAMKSGAQDYLVKGKTSPEDLRRVVHNAIEKSVMQRALTEQRRALAEKNFELERVLESLRLLERGVHHSTESIIITSAELDLPGPKIVFVNEAFTHMTGYTANEAIGLTPRILHGPDTERAVLDELRGKLGRGEVFYGIATNYRKDGTPFILEWSVAPVRNAKGDVTHYVAAQHDITERKRAEAERTELLQREQAARREAEEANRLKDEFLATASHELRTPLTAILGWSNLLQTGRLDKEAVQQAIQTIERNARAQNQLICDLLDVSRIITGKLHLDVRPVNLTEVIRAALDVVRLAADAKSIKLEAEFDPRTEEITGDAARLQQVVWNLLANAIKFTLEGGRIEVKLQQLDRYARIIVSDTGQGIAPEFLPFVFDRFRQADSTITRKHAGLGLGLAIVRHLTELHGGTVRASSSGEHQGATFTIDLPLALKGIPVAHEPAETLNTEKAEQAKTERSFARLGGVRVLLVEDEEDTRMLLALVLQKAGAEVVSAASAAEGFALFERHEPDVIISDIGMPEEDGYTLIRRVRGMDAEQGREVPAIALTAYAGEENRVKALGAGFDTHLAKPIEPDDIIKAIANLAGRSQQRQVGRGS